MRTASARLDLPRWAIVLSGGILGLSVVYFMVIPLLALYLSVELGSSPTQIGVVLAVMAVANRGLQVFVGLLADRLGTRAVLAAGVCVACAGYLGLATHPSFPLQIGWAAAVGIGTAATSLLGKAMLAEAAPERRPQAFALRAVAVNGGASVGPVAGAVLFGWFEAALVATAAVYAGFLFAVVRKVPGRDATVDTRTRPGQQLRALFGNRALVSLTAASVGFWYLYTQLTFTFPLYANDRFGLEGQIGVFFTVEALVTVVLQYPVVAWLTGRLDGWRIVTLGCTCLAVAFLVLGGSPRVWGLLVFVVTFAVGALLVIPTLDVLASDLSPQRTLAGSLGVVSLGWAAGGLLGSVLGGVGYELARDGDSYPAFWMVNASIAVAVAVAFAALRRRWPHPGPSAAPTPEGETDDGTDHTGQR